MSGNASLNDAKQKNVTMQGWTARPLSFFPSGFARGSTMVFLGLAMFLFVKRTPLLIGHLCRSQLGLGNLRADHKRIKRMAQAKPLCHVFVDMQEPEESLRKSLTQICVALFCCFGPFLSFRLTLPVSKPGGLPSSRDRCLSSKKVHVRILTYGRLILCQA